MSMNLLDLLKDRKLIVGDGAMGTQLMSKGLAPGECGEMWNLQRPEEVENIQRSYVEAGADYLLTNTFGGSAIALARHGLQGRTEEVNMAATQIARRAAGGWAMVFGDVGPTGQMLRPIGELSEGDAQESFRRQISAFCRAGVDAIIAETFDSADELALVMKAAREACDLPLIASMRFQRERTGRYRTIMGEAPERLVGVAEEWGCVAAGTNCGLTIEAMVPLVERLAELTDLPVIAQPNAGLPELVAGRTVYRQDAGIFARHVPALHGSGARIIGGCCGTTAEHIGAIRRFADSL